MEFILGILIVVALIWLLGFALSGQILLGCALFLFATCTLGLEFKKIDAGGVFGTIDRMWMLTLVAIAILQRSLGLSEPKAWTKFEWTIVAFIVLLGIHCIILNDPNEKGKMSGSPMWHLVIGYLYPVFLYFIARQAVLSEQRVLGFHIFLMVFGLYLAVTGICEMTQQWWAVWPKYIADPEVGLHYGRARGPMVQSVSYGYYLSVCLAATACCFLRWGIKGKILALPIAAAILIAAFLTHTRSVWMGTALVGLIVVATSFRDPWRKIFLTCAVVGGLLIVAVKFDSIMGFQREGTVEDTKSSAECRGAFAVVSWHMFLDKPVFGFGFGNFPEEKLPYLNRMHQYDMIMEHIRGLIHHNTYLDLLTELGLVGFVLYLGIMYGWGRNAWQLLGSTKQSSWVKWQGVVTLSALGSYAIQMAFHEVTFTSIDNSVMYLLAGISSGLVAKRPYQLRQDLGRQSDQSVLNEWLGQANRRATDVAITADTQP